MDLSGKVTDEQIQEARERRSRVEQPLEADPGMADDLDWGPAGDSVFGSGGAKDPFGSDDGWGGGGGGGDSWGGSSGGGGGWGSEWGSSSAFGAPAAPAAPPEKSSEDKIFDAVKLIMMGFVTFLGELVKSFKEFDPVARVGVGRTSILISVVTAVLGVVLLLFGRGIGLQLIVGSLLSMGVGVMLFMFAYDAVTNEASGGAPSSQPSGSPFEEDTDSLFGGGQSTFGSDSSDFDSSEIMWGGASDSADEPEIVMFGEEDDEEGVPESPTPYSWDDISEPEPAPVAPRSTATPEELLNSVPNTMLSREYLFGVMKELLPLKAPTFAESKEVDPDSTQFAQYDSFVQEAAARIAPSSSTDDENLVYLKKAEDGMMFLMLVTSRPKWVKASNADNIAKELQAILQYDVATGKKNTHLFCTVDPVGSELYFKIVKDAVVTVTVGDIFRTYEQDIKDTSNRMPVALGLDASGRAVIKDFSSINALLIAGKPRSGKSWTALAQCIQIMMFKSPREVNFYFCDPKGMSSDFYQVLTPHVKSFSSDIEDIFNTFRYLVNVEGERRKQYIGDKGYQNVVDYRMEHPEDESLPDIYLVVDEVISAVEQAEDKKREFNSLLKMLVSQLPGFGIRLFMVPHLIKHEVVSKTISDLIPCRISVKGDASHIIQTTDYKKFDTPLLYQGSMAARFDSDEPIFIQSAILSETNSENGKIIDFLRRFWSQACPEQVENSEYTKRESARKRTSVAQDVVDVVPSMQAVPVAPVVAAPVASPVVSEGVKGPHTLPLKEVNEMLQGVHEGETPTGWNAPSSEKWSTEQSASEPDWGAFSDAASDDELFNSSEAVDDASGGWGAFSDEVIAQAEDSGLFGPSGQDFPTEQGASKEAGAVKAPVKDKFEGWS